MQKIYNIGCINKQFIIFVDILGGSFLAEIKFEITEQIAVLSESPKGWTKELNLISWNGREPKYDIRDWAPNHEKMGKGVTLDLDEVLKLKKALQDSNI